MYFFGLLFSDTAKGYLLPYLIILHAVQGVKRLVKWADFGAYKDCFLPYKANCLSGVGVGGYLRV